jgi:predicted transcriptional regulator
MAEEEQSNDWWDELSEAQQLHINEGVEDAENGRLMSSTEFWDKLKNSKK